MPEQRGGVGAVRDEVALAVQQRAELRFQRGVGLRLVGEVGRLEFEHAAICNGLSLASIKNPARFVNKA